MMHQRRFEHGRTAPAVPTGHGAPPARLRLLVESGDRALAISEFRAFEEAGFDVAVCAGPGADADECPLVRGEPCELAAAADAVLTGFDPHSASGAAVLWALHRHHPDVPVVLHSRQGHLAVHEGVTQTLPFPTSINGQVPALRRHAFRRPRLTDPPLPR